MAFGGSRRQKRLLVAGVILVAGWLAQQAGIDVSSLVDTGTSNRQAESRIENRSESRYENQGEGARESSARSNPSSTSGSSSSVQRIERAIAARESGFMVTLDARVVKILRDDLDGSRHQRFLIELEGGRTLLVAHNIDLADRVPIEEGESVRVRGQYEWNDRDGVLHWTHHDPDGDHPGGWIEARGRRVQ